MSTKSPDSQHHDAATPDLLVALATYNELANLPALVERIREHCPAADILVVDDNSPDGTGDWCRKQALDNSDFHVIHRPEKMGLGSAMLEIFQFARKRQYAALVTMDADGSHPAERIPALVDNLQQHDLVIGSRYCPGGDIVGWPWHRRAMSKGVNWLSRALLGLTVRDTSGAFRAYRLATLEQLSQAPLRSEGFAILEELLWRLSRTGIHMGEVPIRFQDRDEGESKLNTREALHSVATIVRLGIRNRMGI